MSGVVFYFEPTLYLCVTERHSGDGVTNSSPQLSDVNKHDTTTATYEPLDENTQTPVNYQQLPSPSSPSDAGRQDDYSVVNNSSNINKETPYHQLNTETQPPVVYQQLA